MNIKNLIGSLVIVLLGITYFFVLQSYVGKSTLQSEIRDAYSEVQRISDELATTDEPGRIKEVVANFATQVVDGIKSGFKGNNTDLIRFNKVRQKISISDLSRGTTQWKNKEKFIGVIRNNSDHPVSQIRANLVSYSKEGKMIDVSVKWRSAIKLLPPAESFPFTVERELGSHSLSAEELNSRKAASFEIRVVSFQVLNLSEK